MISYRLKEVAGLVDGRIEGKGENSFVRLHTDSRKNTDFSETLFIAITGERHNGHVYIKEMYDKGVRSFLISEPVVASGYPEAGFLRVEDSLAALQRIAEYHRGKYDLPVVAITGSNGKTIVKEWLAQCLDRKYRVVRSPRSYNSQLGVPLSVWLMNQDAEVAVFEAGISRPGEMQKLECIIQPTDGLITNIGEAHQQSFQSIPQKVQEKITLFRKCGRIFYCSDYEDIHRQVSEKYPETELCDWSFSRDSAKMKVRKISQQLGGTLVRVKYGNHNYMFKIPFTDNASIENSIHVVNYLINNGWNAKEIDESLEKLQPVAMRLEQVKGANNCVLINDSYNSDINSLSIALDYLRQQPFKNKSLILSDILQAGLEDDVLYKRVAELVKQTGINTFIGIGESIRRFAHYFDFTNGIFFSNTQEFLSSGKVLTFNNEAILLKAARLFKFENIVAVLSEKNHTTVLEINLDNLTGNLNYFRSLLQQNTGIMVMVKALAYGSGSYEIANLLQYEQVDYLGVAFTDEGVQLRQSGITLPIMVMSPYKEDFVRVVEYELEPEIYSFSSLDSFIQSAERLQVTEYPVHIKLDTGMHRLGFMEKDIEGLVSVLSNTRSVAVKGVFSHLAASDMPEYDGFSNGQIELFLNMYQQICDGLKIKPMRHVLNSAGIERFPEAHFEMVRLGIGVHGVSTQKELLPVSALKTHITQIKEVPGGASVGYSRMGKVDKDKTIAIIPVGYADGLNRRFGNGVGEVLIRNRKAPFIGNICMDMSMLDITGIDCEEGDEVVIFGAGNPITALAEKIGTIPYEILTSVSDRVKRVYVKE